MRRFALVLFTLFGTVLSAQPIDNLNLLTTDGLHGTPRYQAMGGAFTALGNDLSAIHLNPAGAAVYRSDNFGLSLGFQGQTDRVSFLGNKDHNESFNLLFENIGLVKKFGSKSTPLTFSVTYNKMADFNSEFDISGVNQKTFNDPFEGGREVAVTLGRYWLEGVWDMTIPEMEAAGQLSDEFFQAASAANATLLLVDSLGAYSIDYYPLDFSEVNYNFRESGNRSEALFNLGAQVNEKWFFGFAIGVPNLNYSNASSLTESGFADSSYFRDYTLNQWNEVYATGVNIKLGAIGRPTQWLRVGLSYQSPTWYRVSETYSLSVDATAYNGERYLGTEYIFDDIRYSVTAPSIFRGGAAVVLAKKFIASVDYEYSNPSNLSLNSRDGNNYDNAEALFQSETQATNTLKAGLEYRIGPTYLRGGYQLRQSNFADADAFVSDRNVYSVGFGYANRNFGIDIGYSVTAFTYNYVVHPYLGDPLVGSGVEFRDRTLASDDITKGNFSAGVSFKF